ncbi:MULTISPECIES: M23 family metallopeptidase [unclassified Sporolactobacillus]|uniref:M23 family metallopeptidase n=1 Tax=unclassified Sporolactobacillus TaxID=2628533 RepID=UPI0023682394|nr:M23 family metallopeptidase [Sporolactobacillus sp. CQH2019]MDD9147394.1 M23 family metallopeptidase [Sporolactobacillus sp. CQH2019]
MIYFSRIASCVVLLFILSSDFASAKTLGEKAVSAERKSLYLKTSALTGVPWSVIAGCDQYARNTVPSARSGKADSPLVGLNFGQKTWVGLLNPDENDEDPKTIALFGGAGKDGNGDGRARLHDPEDRLFAFAERIAEFGPGEQNYRIAIWNIYRRGKAVDLIEDYARLFEAFNSTDLYGHAFPLPLRSNYDYKSTWGERRGWGGLRHHEGTDLFADYGTPVRATAYGIVEMTGWNKYGGWRLGIRDIRGNYHYFAHLSSYAPHIHKGTITKPGQEIGYVGSSGYGPPGTQGKFPPHLHYGIYRDNGRTEFSFDPYPVLRVWERQARAGKH